MRTLASGAVHTLASHGFTALFADEPLASPSAGDGRARRFAAALFDDSGGLRYATSGESAEGAYEDSVSGLRLSEDGTLTVDYRRGSDFSGLEPVLDLRIAASGGAARGYFAVSDADGWSQAPFGLYHGASGRRLEAPSTVRHAHGEHAGLFAVSYVERLGDTTRITVFDGRRQSSFEVPGTLVEYTESASQFVAPSVLLLRTDRLPAYRVDLSNQRVEPLLVGLDPRDITIADVGSTGLGRDVFRVSLYDASGNDIVDAFLVDTVTGTVIRLSDVGASSRASVMQGQNVWYVWDEGKLRFGLRRDTGAIVSLPSPPSPEADMQVTPIELAERALVLSGGRPWAELDFTTDELSVFPPAETEGLEAVDNVSVHGGFIVGSSAGVPRWFTRDGSDRFTTLPSRAELGGGAAANYATSDANVPGSPASETVWLLVHEDGRPRVALSLPDAELVRVAPGTLALAPADRIEAHGEWAFGFVRAPVEKDGLRWLEAYRAVWRIHLPSGRISVVPEVAGYSSLYEQRYVISPGSNLEYYIADRDFVFSDGTIAVVRRDEREARVFVLDAESESFAPIGEPFTHVVAVSLVHGAGYFAMTPVGFDCYCVEPMLDWGPGEPDTSRHSQLVLIEGDSLRTVTGGNWSFSADASCVAVASDEAGHFARDFATGTTTSLPPASSWHWLEPGAGD
jgi:hypothetical protein